MKITMKQVIYEETSKVQLQAEICSTDSKTEYNYSVNLETTVKQLEKCEFESRLLSIEDTSIPIIHRLLTLQEFVSGLGHNIETILYKVIKKEYPSFTRKTILNLIAIHKNTDLLMQSSHLTVYLLSKAGDILSTLENLLVIKINYLKSQSRLRKNLEGSISVQTEKILNLLAKDIAKSLEIVSTCTPYLYNKAEDEVISMFRTYLIMLALQESLITSTAESNK